MLYVLVNGCTWKNIPSDFPNWHSVYKYYRKLVYGKYLDKILFKLNFKLTKQKLKRINNRHSYLPMYILVTDSQSARGTDLQTLGIKGLDGHKKIKGNKRFICL